MIALIEGPAIFNIVVFLVTNNINKYVITINNYIVIINNYICFIKNFDQFKYPYKRMSLQ